MKAAVPPAGPPISRVEVSAYTIPTETPESDGTLEWTETTLVLVEVQGGGHRGIGYTYAAPAAAMVVRDLLADVVTGIDLTATNSAWESMGRRLRNAGRPGIASHALSAVDVALWDLKSRYLGMSLVSLLGSARDELPVYGSGGFTSYDRDRLVEQLRGWTEEGIPRVKMKVGRRPAEDVERVRAVREAIGDGPELFVDANGALDRKQALHFAARFSELGVSWFEEPVSSDDVDGLRLIRDRAPPGLEITAGEYGYDSAYFRRMLEAGAVDVLMLDATRCGGYTGFLRAAALCEAFQIPISAHTAPALHLSVCCCAPAVRHLEYFFDHVRIEQLLFEGVPRPVDGALRPDPARPGHGLEFRRSDAGRFAVAEAA